MKGKIIYFKANLNYDDEVIDFAMKTGLKIRNQLNDPELKVCCGIDPGHDGTKWEPILVLNDTDLEGYKTPEEIEKEKQEQEKKAMQDALRDQNQPLVEFKNDENDPRFIKLATTFTLIMIGVAFVSKLLMIHNKTFMTSNRWNALLLMAQMGGFVLTLVGYNKKMSKTKLFAFIACVASIFMFDFLDVVVGVLTALFTVDHHMVLKLLDLSKQAGSKGKELMKELTTKNTNHKPTMDSPVVPTTLPPEPLPTTPPTNMV